MNITLTLARGALYRVTSFTFSVYFDIGLVSKVEYSCTRAADNQTNDVKDQFHTTVSIYPSGDGLCTAFWNVPGGTNLDLVLSLELDSVPLFLGYTIKAFTVAASWGDQPNAGETPMPSTASFVRCLNTNAYYEMPC
jgi:hypothetical protein